MFITVAIASKGRPQVLHGTLLSVMRQRRLPDEIIVVVTAEEDLNDAIRQMENVYIVYSTSGLTHQRNVALSVASDSSDVIVFLDDDVEIAHDYFERIENYMELNPDVVACSGTPVLNRAENGLMPRAKAVQVLENDPPRPVVAYDRHGLYGCNMVVRTPAARIEQFDERLGGYAFGEDGDFGVRMQKHGRVTEYSGGRLIHFGTPSGRISQVAHGFVQVMNPSYLFFVKRTYNLRDFVIGPVMSFAANVLGNVGLGRFMLSKDPAYYNRRLRLRGNLLAIRYILQGKIDPGLLKNVIEE